MQRNFIYILFTLIFIACNSKPKVIVADAPVAGGDTSAMSAQAPSGSMTQSPPGMDNNVHRVVANEILQTDKYTYLNVTENGRKFWIATTKTDAVKGKAYIYQGGLLKTNFESREYKRVFDTLYLVMSIMDENQHPGGQGQMAGAPSTAPVADEGHVHQHAADAVKISELFANRKKYEGQVITLEGDVVKVNNGIMGRNWIHLRDGSKVDGKPAEVTITSQSTANPGDHIGLKGKVSLNKDFGAGYRYDIIIEEAQAL